jgi:hypothetical protein
VCPVADIVATAADDPGCDPELTFHDDCSERPRWLDTVENSWPDPACPIRAVVRIGTLVISIS